MHEAILGHRHDIAGLEPSVIGEGCARFLRILPITCEHLRPFDLQLSRGRSGYGLALIIHHT
ncbi:Uncharacterised protein [Mycobacterium tuberculosis]|nr:Uncharacterised protein [Mycobacterium tuberculosis]